jgi:ATP:ADP antiporter, AAA family
MKVTAIARTDLPPAPGAAGASRRSPRLSSAGALPGGTLVNSQVLTFIPGERRRGPTAAIARVMSLLAPVRASEVLTLLLLTANVMLLLGSYYLLKTAREPLILNGGAEVKAYASAAQAVLLMPIAHAFGVLSRRMARMQLVALVTAFFASNLVGFWLLDRAGVPIGVPFYVWVGVFNMTVIAQFWTFVADVYTPEQGRRLLTIVGLGAALGGLFGARVARTLYGHVGVGGLFLIAGALLMVGLALTALVDRRCDASDGQSRKAPPVDPMPGHQGSGLQLVLGDRYLQLIAGLVVLLNLVNTTGEYILDRTLVAEAHAQALVPAGQYIANFKADFFTWVNAIGIGLQLLVVSRVIKHLGVGVGLYILPLVALGGYGALAVAPLLSVVFLAKVAENSLDYSLQATVRQTLYLPTSRAAKYRAKPLIDTFVVRSGDVVASGLVLLGHRLAFETSTFAAINVAVTIAWLLVARRLSSRHRRIEEAMAAAPGVSYSRLRLA